VERSGEAEGGIMNMLLLACAGAGIGLGIAAVTGTLVTARPQLADALAAPHQPAAVHRPAGPNGVARTLGSPAAAALAALGLPRASVRADLAALGRPVHQHLAQQAGLALLATIAGPLYGFGLAVVGIRPPLQILAAATLILAMAGYLLPSRLAHAEANRLREAIRYATSAMLDLVAVMLAAGCGQEEAFTLAAATGHGPGHEQLRAALGAARTTRTPIWDELAELGRRTGVRELTELAATSLLAGTEGAKIRDTLATKAASLRARLLAAAETKAASATERMGMPTVLLMVGFLIFTCYPALAQVMKSL
jgi:Flp pilus assembly protein TadB